MAPETEAPAEMHIWLPALKALNLAENAEVAATRRAVSVARNSLARETNVPVLSKLVALRGEIARLRDEIVEPATPMPLRERLGQRATQLNKLVEQHERTRPADREEADGDR